ncbi:MAG: putative baseplate assembly protein [Actinobacteria bacterium]|nr:putative baseplate assembly protein [Actinomycetota bacterium]
MLTHYLCRDDERRDLARAAGVNGIDYLEVLDGEAPDGAPRQRTLLVYFLAPLTGDIDPSAIEVTGGARIIGVEVQWAARETTVDPGLVSPAELAFYGSVGSNVLIVRTARYGDHSTYTLHIDGLGPPEFDPRLSTVDFSFKAECPHDFDCAPETECPPEVESEPPIDYMARDYAGFRRLMLDRLSVVLPEWSDRNQVPDIQVALVEAMAYVGDRLSYHQDAVATEAYIGTALQRPSLRRHGRLLDYRLHEGCNARTWVHVDVTGSAAVVVPKGSQLLTRLATATPVVPHPDVVAGPPHPYEEAMAQRPTVFEAMEGIVAFGSHNEVDFYTWGDEQCCLQKGATKATLRDGTGTDRLRLRRGDVVVFEQVVDPVTGAAADADPAARHAVRLTKVTPEANPVALAGQEIDRTPGLLITDPLPIGGVQQPIVEIEWDERDSLPFPLCISEEIDGTLRTDLAVARANVLIADHGRTITSEESERLVVPKTTKPFRPSLEGRDITFSASLPVERPAASVSIMQDPKKALAAIGLTEDNGQVWEPVPDLLNSDRFARDFVVELHNDRRSALRFGDGIKGREPVRGTLFDAVYRLGNGAKGNLGRDSLSHIVAPSATSHAAIQGKVTGIRNPQPAAGGIDPEPAGHVPLYAPEAFRVQERAVTETDYAEVSERRRDIQKAAGTRRWTGSWHTMFVTADRYRGLAVDDEFDRKLTRYLDRYRLAGQDVEIDGPRFVPLDIELSVCAKADHFRADVKQALLDALSCKLRADGSRGFFHPDNFTFGDTLYLSSLVSAVMDVAGVEWVDVTRFQRWQEEPDDELADAKIDFGRLEIPQVDNDPNAPENGRLLVTMVGGK